MSRIRDAASTTSRSGATHPFIGSDKIMYAIDGVSPFNMHLVIRGEGRLDASCLSRAIELTLARVPILKSVARLRSVAPYWEVVQGATAWSLLESGDLSHHVGAQRAARQLIDEFINREIDITQSQPARFLFLQLPDEQWVFIVKTHHCPFDGAALFVLTQDIRASYEALVKGEPIPPPEEMGGRSRWPLLRSVSPWLWGRAGLMTLWQRMSRPWPGRKRFIEFSAPTASRGISYRSIELEGDDYERFRSRCACLGASTNDVILAALCGAIYRWNEGRGPGDGIYSFVMPVDLRRYLARNERLPRIVASFVGGTQVRVPVSAAARIEEALEVVRRETGFIKSHHLALLPNVIFPLLYLIPPRWLRRTARRLYERRPDRFAPTAVISNMGRADKMLPSSPDFTIRSIEGVGAAYAPAGLFVAIVTYLQRQTITITYRRDVCSEEEIDGFVRVFSAALRSNQPAAEARAAPGAGERAAGRAPGQTHL